ncbi:MAG: helix-turn-helix domain-containing protein [Desulfosarcina sp.]
MVTKHPIYPDRIRKIPRQFSWLDHRLVSEHYIDRCTHRAAALYLFLVTVADAHGMSYYSTQTLARRLGMDEQAIRQIRSELISLGLIAYRKPLVQVLAIDAEPIRPTGTLQSVEQIFKHLGEGGQ